MNQLSTADRTRVLACLVEGNSQRATVRMTGIAKGTVAKLAVEIGRACESFADRVMVNLPCTHIHMMHPQFQTDPLPKTGQRHQHPKPDAKKDEAKKPAVKKPDAPAKKAAPKKKS